MFSNFAFTFQHCCHKKPEGRVISITVPFLCVLQEASPALSARGSSCEWDPLNSLCSHCHWLTGVSALSSLKGGKLCGRKSAKAAIPLPSLSSPVLIHCCCWARAADLEATAKTGEGNQQGQSSKWGQDKEEWEGGLKRQRCTKKKWENWIYTKLSCISIFWKHAYWCCEKVFAPLQTYYSFSFSHLNISCNKNQHKAD